MFGEYCSCQEVLRDRRPLFPDLSGPWLSDDGNFLLLANVAFGHRRLQHVDQLLYRAAAALPPLSHYWRLDEALSGQNGLSNWGQHLLPTVAS